MEKEPIYKQNTSQVKSLIAGIDNKVGALANVTKFPRHIACSSKSRSEIFVPVFKDGDVVAVIDVDSANINAFDDKDKEGLEKIAGIIRRFMKSK